MVVFVFVVVVVAVVAAVGVDVVMTLTDGAPEREKMNAAGLCKSHVMSPRCFLATECVVDDAANCRINHSRW